MELTRRLYVLEEVAAAFRWTMKQGRKDEALFWLEELEVSAEGDLAARCMVEIWAMRKGVIWLPWIVSWCVHHRTVNGRRALLKAYLAHSKDKLDSSLWMSYVLSCLDDTYWRGFPLYRKTPLDIGPHDDPLQLCISAWIAVDTSVKPLALELEEWDLEAFEQSLQGNLRAKRLMEIPCYCHLGFTQRGLNVGTKLECVHLYTLLQNPVWVGLLEPFVTEDYEWRDDSAKEEFYDKYFGFVGDVPDEWSKAEREKSHGQPPAARDSYSLLRWWNSWVPENHLYIFGQPLRMLRKILETTQCTVPVFTLLTESETNRKGDRCAPSLCRTEFVFEG